MIGAVDAPAAGLRNMEDYNGKEYPGNIKKDR